MSKLDMELYESKIEVLGMDSVDFVIKNDTYIRIQVIVKGAVKVIPSDLVDDIAKLIASYDIGKLIKEKRGHN